MQRLARDYMYKLPKSSRTFGAFWRFLKPSRIMPMSFCMLVRYAANFVVRGKDFVNNWEIIESQDILI